MKISRRQLRKIILDEARRSYYDPRGNLDRTLDIVPSDSGPRPNHPFFNYNPRKKDPELARAYDRARQGFYEDEKARTESDYDPESEFGTNIDIDHETGIEEIPAEEEDVGEMARYHALNNDKDEILYRDNPDYKNAYDEISSDMIEEGFFSSMFGRKKTPEEERRERAAETLRKLKSGELSLSDIKRTKGEMGELDKMKDGIDSMIRDLGGSPDESKEERLARLRRQIELDKLKGREAFKTLRKAGYWNKEGLSEGKEEEEFLRWYFGSEKVYEKEAKWYDFGGNYQNLSLSELIDEEEEKPKKKD